jgi:DNA-binding CsgD family transcriptional regulator
LPVFDLDKFSHVVAHIYDSAIDVARWPNCLRPIAQTFGGRGAQISFGPSAMAAGLDVTVFAKFWGWTEEELASAVPRYLALSHTDPRQPPALVHHKAIHCRQFVSDERLHESEIYKESLLPFGIEYAMYFMVPINDERMSVLSVMRGPDGVAFTSEDCMELGRLIPHVGRAVTMHGAFHQHREELATVRALLDGVPLGMMVVEDDELTVANRAARRLLEEGDALHVHAGHLRGATRRADVELREAVREARSSDDRAIGVVLPIDDAEPVRAVVRRLHSASAGMLGAPSEAVALYVTDPRQPIESPEEVLQRLFGLTGREATVLRVLVEGGDLKQAAASLGMAYETARTHVRHIMETTGARRQTDLVRMVLTSPAWIAGPAARSSAPARKSGDKKKGG